MTLQLAEKILLENATAQARAFVSDPRGGCLTKYSYYRTGGVLMNDSDNRKRA